jgi:hypothetical protein
MITGAQTLWWLALPVLLLPIWWHRQKRQRVKSEPLATARFLPAAPPQTARVWRWEDLTLLALRCLLLAALIAWLAATTMPWRGDTVFIDPALTAHTSQVASSSEAAQLRGPPSASAPSGALAPSAWLEQQIAAAGMSAAPRMPLPADALQWLQANEHAWRSSARLLVLAKSIAMPAQLPMLAHATDIRILPTPAAAAPPASASAAANTAPPAGTSPAASAALPASSPIAADAAPSASSPIGASAALLASAPIAASPALSARAPEAGLRVEHRVSVSAPPERMAAWRALFAAFSAAGGGDYTIEDKPGATTELIVWDSPAAPPPGWQAPLWWLPAPGPMAAFGANEPPAKPLTINGLPLQITDSPRGRLWISPAFPPRSAEAAGALYETWQSLSRPAQPYPMPAVQLPPRRSVPLAMPDTPPAAWLAYVLLALFALERLMTHVRRR